MSALHRIAVLDSHTGGEPTRVVLSGGPDLGKGPLADRARLLGEKFDHFRSAIVNEPRGSDVMVGALLVEPHDGACQFGVIFFNNVGMLGMCGHGMIGLIVSLAHLGRIGPGQVRVDTPVGVISAELHLDGTVSIQNVPSYRKAANVAVQVPGLGEVRGDVAWGGNWFFLVANHGLALNRDQIEALTDFACRVRKAINAQGFPEVNHVELFAPSSTPGVDSRNFVLCPGKAYDRSPCGTGTSAKLACLAADGKLAEGAEWIQESIVGSLFRTSYRREGATIIPRITGAAHIDAEATLLLDSTDPFQWGMR